MLDYEEWGILLPSLGGYYNPEAVEPEAWTGWQPAFQLRDVSMRCIDVGGIEQFVRID